MDYKIRKLINSVYYSIKGLVDNNKRIKSKNLKNKIISKENVKYTKQCIENYKKLGLDDYDVVELIISVNDVDYTKNIVEHFQSFGLDDYCMHQLIKSVDDEKYTIQCIERSKELNINSYIIASLIQDIKDIEVVKKYIKNAEKIGLDGFDIVKIVNGIGNIDLKKECIFNREDYGIDDFNLIELFEGLDVETVKDILRNEKIQLDNFVVKDIVDNVNDAIFFEEVISNPNKFGLSAEDISLLHMPKELKIKMIKNPDKYFLDMFSLMDIIGDEMEDDIKELIYSDEIDGDLKENLLLTLVDEEFVKKCIKDAKIIGLSSDNIMGLIELSGFDSKDVKKYIKMREEIGLKSFHVIYLIKKIQDSKFTNKCIKEREKYGFSDIDILSLLETDKDKIDFLLKKNSKELMQSYRKKASIDFLYNNLHTVLEIEGIDEERKKILLRMYEKNNDVLKTNFELLDKRIVEILGEDMVNQLSCYPKITSNVIKMSNKKLEVFNKCIKDYIGNNEEKEWTTLANRLLQNIDNCTELINSIDSFENVNMDNLTRVILNGNKFEIKDVNDINNYNLIKKVKCDEMIKSDNMTDKKEALLYKVYDFGIDTAKDLLYRYGSEIEKIDDLYLKKYMQSVEEVLMLKNKESIEEIYNKIVLVESVKSIDIERQLKDDFSRKFNDGLFKVEDMDVIDDRKDLEDAMINQCFFDDEKEIISEKLSQCKIVDAGTDFKMIVTSIAPFVINQPDNFKEDWNRTAIGSQHFCTNYIRNDMLGIVDVPHVMYGFSSMDEHSLMLSGPTDIWSSGVELESSAGHDEIYYNPDAQINNTINRGYGSYNEMDWRRIQNGKKKQPDFIVVFKRGRELIGNGIEILKACEDWNFELPIVVVDINNVLETEREKADKMINQYEKEPSAELAKNIYNCIQNNRKTTSRFSMKEFKSQVDVDIYKKEFEGKVSESDLAGIYSMVSAKERENESAKLKALYRELDIIRDER